MGLKDKGYTIKCTSHTYVTLYWNRKLIFCLDNDLMCAEEIIYEIEQRTKLDFREIPIIVRKEDFQGLIFHNGGWKRDFWKELPDKKEIENYMKSKNGFI